MAIHTSVRRIISEFESKELHAARSGREVMEALSIVLAESQATNIDELTSDLDLNIDALLDAMPAYAPPLNVVHKIFCTYEEAVSKKETVPVIKERIADHATAFGKWSENTRRKIADLGTTLIPMGGTVFTFTFSETVYQTLRYAWNKGKKFRVLVTESRPNNDGRLTAKSLAEEGIKVDIGIDSGINEFIPQADLMLIGAEAILSDGSVICKVGTYPAALVAKRNSIPVYVLADSLKLHTLSLFGYPMELDPIQRNDMCYEEMDHGVRIGGFLFDHTPPELITGLVTEKGLIHPNLVSQWMQEMPMSKAVINRFRS